MLPANSSGAFESNVQFRVSPAGSSRFVARFSRADTSHYAAAIEQIEETGGARYESLDELITVARSGLVLPERYPRAGETS